MSKLCMALCLLMLVTMLLAVILDKLGLHYAAERFKDLTETVILRVVLIVIALTVLECVVSR